MDEWIHAHIKHLLLEHFSFTFYVFIIYFNTCSDIFCHITPCMSIVHNLPLASNSYFIDASATWSSPTIISHLFRFIYQGRHRPNNEPLNWDWCAGTGNHLKHRDQWVCLTHFFFFKWWCTKRAQDPDWELSSGVTLMQEEEGQPDLYDFLLCAVQNVVARCQCLSLFGLSRLTESARDAFSSLKCLKLNNLPSFKLHHIISHFVLSWNFIYTSLFTCFICNCLAV